MANAHFPAWTHYSQLQPQRFSAERAAERCLLLELLLALRNGLGEPGLVGNTGWEGRGQVSHCSCAPTRPKLSQGQRQHTPVIISLLYYQVSTDSPLLNLRSSFFIHIPYRNNIVVLRSMVFICGQGTKETSINNNIVTCQLAADLQGSSEMLLCFAGNT